MSVAHGRLVELFERIVALPFDEREGVLAECDPDTRVRLQRLLEADGETFDPLAQAIEHEALTLVSPQSDGVRLGAYRVLRELGAGGMGAVLLAERADGQFQQQVAIKLIRGFPTDDGRRRLRQERQILAQLDHPFIAHLLDGGETEDGQPYVVMEYVAGLPLLDHLVRHPLPLRARLALFDQIAAAVQHAHERLVIHRDLKPGNVLVRDDGEPRLLDFGVAKLVDVSADSDSRQTSTRVWTPGYASPEQRAGGLITTASDVYGLAILLREMLTGERVPGVASAPDGFKAVSIDAELRGIIAKAAADEPAQRYPTVEALRADLQRWRDGRPVRAAPDTPLYRARKFVRRHRLWVALGAAALAGVAVFVWRLDTERDRALAAEATAEHARVAAEREAGNARATLSFLARAFEAASPQNALSTHVSVRDLLDQARKGLDQQLGDRSEVRQPIERLLGRFYLSLGEPRIAEQLFADGLRGAQATQRAEALALAADHDDHSTALGALERGEDALAAALRAEALRKQFAPDDEVERLRTLDQLGFAHYRMGDYAAAERDWDQALALAATMPDPPVEVVTNVYQALGNVLAERGEVDKPLELAEAGLRFAEGRIAPTSPERVPLLRAKAQALEQAGRYTEAEALLRQAIALQEQSVGSGGHRTGLLLNGLGLVLNQMGRYREAVELMERSHAMTRSVQAGRLDNAISISNIASVYENAGDYARALDLFDEVLSSLDEGGIEADATPRRSLERNRARTLALAGRTGEAREILTHLRARALALEGEDSFEYAMTTWQLTVAARVAGDFERGLPLLEQSRAAFAAIVPAKHPVLSHMKRAQAHFLRARGDLAGAEAVQREALAELQALEVLPVDVAIAQAELARLEYERGRSREARALLDQALPVMREVLLAGELNRREAEVLDRALR
jgi:eukaryotic-like serine/threonine-protein kinase